MVGLRHFIIVIGAVYCTAIGWVIGGCAGAVLGYILASILLTLLAEFYDKISQKRRRRRLQAFFGEYYAPEKGDDWEQIKAQLKCGDIVKGVVVHKGRPQAVVDIGCGFPAFLYKTQREKSAGDSLETDALPHELGDEIEAQITAIDDAKREFAIAQRVRWLLFEGEMIGRVAFAEDPIEGTYNLRPIQNEAYATFINLPKKETARYEVLTGDETRRVDVKKSAYGCVSIRLLEEAVPNSVET